MELYKYQGAGNDFLLIDARQGGISLPADRIASMCDRRYGIGADGLMLLQEGDGTDFTMVYFNSDGSGGMMCGNGGRCIVAFAADLGIAPSNGEEYVFEAADGLHRAAIVSDSSHGGGSQVRVRLSLKDVDGITPYGNPYAPAPVMSGSDDALSGYFLDTGTRHFVKFVSNLEDYDVFKEGRSIRYKGEFAPVGTNVNFIEPLSGILHVRTYEKGVEDETFACGTGITASAIAFYHHLSGAGNVPRQYRDALGRYSDGRVHIDIRALRDSLSVDFMPVVGGASGVWLTGPAARVAKIEM